MTIFYGTRSVIASENPNGMSASGVVAPLPGLQKSVAVWIEDVGLYNGHLKARVVEHNGVVITGVGTTVTVAASGVNNFEAIGISSTSCIVVWRSGAGTTSYSQLLTIAGTSISVSGTTLLASTARFFHLSRIDNTSALFTYEDGFGGWQGRHLYISGGLAASGPPAGLGTGGDTISTSVFKSDNTKAWLMIDNSGVSAQIKVIDVGGPGAGPSGWSVFATVYTGNVHDVSVESVKTGPETAIATYRRSSDNRAFSESYVVNTAPYPYTIYKSSVSTLSYHADKIIEPTVRAYDDTTASMCGRRDPTGSDYITVTRIGIAQSGVGHPYSHLLTNDEQVDIAAVPTFTHFTSHFHIADDKYMVGTVFYNGPPDYLYGQIYALLGISITPITQLHSKQMDASLDDIYLYIACLNPNDNTPLICKMAADLSADGENVYTRSSGTEAEVFCSDQDPNKVWTGGDYGDVRVAVTVDAGSAWEQRDPVPTGVARPFLVGPHADDFLYDFVRPGSGHFGGGTVYHTVDGTTWSGVWTASGAFTANCCDNALAGEYEAAFAAYNGTSFRVMYTPDGFAHIEDITLTIPDLDSTDIILPY
jgi:hypothetical protein